MPFFLSSFIHLNLGEMRFIFLNKEKYTKKKTFYVIRIVRKRINLKVIRRCPCLKATIRLWTYVSAMEFFCSCLLWVSKLACNGCIFSVLSILMKNHRNSECRELRKKTLVCAIQCNWTWLWLKHDEIVRATQTITTALNQTFLSSCFFCVVFRLVSTSRVWIRYSWFPAEMLNHHHCCICMSMRLNMLLC